MVNHLKIGKFERRPVIKRNLIRICIALLSYPLD